MKKILGIVTVFSAVLLASSPANANHHYATSSMQNQSFAATCNGSSTAGALATSREGNAGVRIGTGTVVNICVNGISVGAGNSIIVDQN
jgi:hypothetical protein